MKILSLSILIFCQLAVFGQSKTLRWTNELCEFEGTYDSKKYSEAQLRDTLKLISAEYFPSSIDPTPQSYAKVKTLDVAVLDNEYRLRTDELRGLNIVKVKYFEDFRQRQLAELEQIYRLAKATILGWTEPAKLREVTFAPACVNKYVEPLATGGDPLLATWLEVNQQKRRDNASPDRIKKIYEDQYNSPDKFEYARVEVMTFGWWNCANGFVDRIEHDGQPGKEFEKLFKRVKEQCDEP